jgi:hypothetical protein
VRQQPFREDACERRHVHLHQVRKFGIEHASQRFAQSGVIASDGEDAEAAQQVEIARAFSVVEVLASAATKPDVVADRLEDANHLLV